LAEVSRTKYADSNNVKSVSETTTESMGISYQTSDSTGSESAEDTNFDKSIEISAESESSDSFREDMLESKDQSSEDECNNCTEIRCFYRKALAKLREQFEAVSAENRTLIAEMQLGTVMDIEDS